jgi:hypothetical protein
MAKNEMEGAKKIFTTYFFDSKMEWCKPVDILASSVREAKSICEEIVIKGYKPNGKYETGKTFDQTEDFLNKLDDNNYFIHPRER